jgi:hypothetical protein
VSSQLGPLLEDRTDWIEELPGYQLSVITQLLESGLDEEAIAQRWLEGSPADIAGFGARQTRQLFFRKFLDEVHAFLCSTDQYDEEREAFATSIKSGQASAVAFLSMTLGSQLGTVGPYLGPPVALVLVLIGKMGLNAWCAMMTERGASEATLGDPESEASSE